MKSKYKLTMCRLCLSENQCFLNIFELNDWHGYIAAEVISNLLNFQVFKTDGYPHVVCTKCLVKLTDFRVFKECCQKSIVTYDNMFVSSEILEGIKTELDIDEGGSGLELCEQDPLGETSADVNMKSEEVIIDSSSYEVSEDPLKETEISCGPILLKYEVLPFSRNSHIQEELIHSEVYGNPEKVESTAVLMQDSPQEVRDNVIAPEKGAGRIRGMFECDHCKKVFTTRASLRRHMADHGFGKSYICEEEEGEETAPERVIGERKERFECHCCTKVLMTKNGLKRHLAGHGIGKFFKCDVCGRICVTKWNLISHIRLHTDERPYKCTECSKGFSRDCSLKVHMRIHTKVKPFKCKKCDSTFNHSGNLKVHMRVHSDVKQYSCEVCHVNFKQKNTLTCHMRTHSGDRPYKCTVCSKRFTLLHNLRRHQGVHSGERPHSCPHCSIRFSRRGSLKRHLKKMCVGK